MATVRPPARRNPVPERGRHGATPKVQTDDIPITSLARTLVDLAEVTTRDELRAAFEQAREQGILDMAAVEAAYRRLEWQASLDVLHDVMGEFTE